MRRKILSVVMTVAGVMMLASCLGDDDSSANVVYYGDAAITSFSLGTLNRYYLYNNGDTIKKTEDGTDSTTTVDCSGYSMVIDQLGYAKDKDGNLTKMHPICNADSLPAGTSLKKVVTSISSKNSSVVTLLRLKTDNTAPDTLDYYSSSDSIDFTQPREYRVLSTDGTYYRRYLVTLNVHKEQPDSFAWHKQSMATAVQGKSYLASRTYTTGNNCIYVAATNGTATEFLSKDINDDSKAWTLVSGQTFGAEAYKSIAALNGYLYLYDNGTVYRSQDAANWETVATGISGIRQIVGASDAKIYALASEGIKSSTDGTAWNDEAIDDEADKENLPEENISVFCEQLKTNKSANRIIIMGTTLGEESVTRVWSKIEDPTEETDPYKWTIYNGEDRYALPYMAGMTAMKYDGALFAIGGAGNDATSVKPYAKVYRSADHGLTWQTGTLFTLPAGMTSSLTPAAVNMVADKENHVWIISTATGEAWKMRINRLGWKTEQRAFNE